MTGVIATIPRFQFSNALGVPLVGGLLYTYIAAGTTKVDTFKDQALTIRNTNPILLDETGSCVIWLDPAKAYKFDLRSQAGVTQLGWPIDNVAGAATALSLAPQFAECTKKDELAAQDGADQIGSIQAGIGAVQRTLQDKGRDIVSVLDFMSDAERADYRSGALSLDLTTSYQKALTAISVTGGELYGPDGFAKTSLHLDVPGDNVKLRLSHNAGISYNTPDGIAIRFSGKNAAVEGGMARGFVGPAVWDGTNVAPTYSVIQFLGNNSYARTRLYNIKKVGIWFKDVIDGTAEGCDIQGNYPSSQWTGVETVNYGILFDPSLNATAGNFKAPGNTIKSCVQGIMAANYGAGQTIQGLNIVGGIIEGCWNHGVYSNFTNGAVINGVSFNRCQLPAVVSGDRNIITSCSVYTAVATVGDQRDVVGFSVRDGSGNIVSNCTIKGVAVPAAAVIISFQDVNGTADMNDNLATNNTIEITDGACVAIRFVTNTTTANRNTASGNNIKGPGKLLEGAISFYGKVSALGVGNKANDNTITLTGANIGSMFGVFASLQLAGDFSRNTVEFAFDSPTPINVTTVAFYGCTLCAADDNKSIVRATFGANLTVFGFREYDTGTDNSTSNNINAVDVTKGAAFHPIEAISAGTLLIDQAHTGAPTIPSRRGSRWWRSDGGAGTTFYIRESSADPTLWRAV